MSTAAGSVGTSLTGAFFTGAFRARVVFGFASGSLGSAVAFLAGAFFVAAALLAAFFTGAFRVR